MKLLVITAFEDYTKEIIQIFKQAQITVFSKSPMSGFKFTGQEDEGGNWFAATQHEYNSVMFFAFTEVEKASKAMELVQQSNDRNSSQSKIRAFLMAVEGEV
jgi:hypothetical protein